MTKLSPALMTHLESWLQTTGDAEWIEEVWLFGSRARGTHRPDSDLDLAFVLKNEPSRTAEGESICMRKRWNATLSELLGYEVDTWWLNDPESVRVAPAVAEHGIRLWKRGEL